MITRKNFTTKTVNERRSFKRTSIFNEGYKGDLADLQGLFDAVETAASAAFSKNDATITPDGAGQATGVVVTDNAKLLKAIDSLANELVDEDNKVDYVGRPGSIVETKKGCDVTIGKGALKISVDAQSHVATVTYTFKWPKKGLLLPGKLFI